MSDLIERQAAIDALIELYEYQRDIDPTEAADLVRQGVYLAEKKIEQLPSVQPEIVRCKDCIFGHPYFDVYNGVVDSWIECQNPDGLNRDVSLDGFCSAGAEVQKGERNEFT